MQTALRLGKCKMHQKKKKLSGEWMRKALAFHDAFCIMAAMRTHSDIVKQADAPDVVAAARNVSVHTVRSWIQRNSIPAEHWAAFAQAGWASLSELADAAAERSQGEAA